MITSVIATVAPYVLFWGCLSCGVAALFEVLCCYPFPDWSRGLPRKFKAICLAISPLGISFFLCVGLFFCVRWFYRELTGYGE